MRAKTFPKNPKRRHCIKPLLTAAVPGFLNFFAVSSFNFAVKKYILAVKSFLFAVKKYVLAVKSFLFAVRKYTFAVESFILAVKKYTFVVKSFSFVVVINLIAQSFLLRKMIKSQRFHARYATVAVNVPWLCEVWGFLLLMFTNIPKREKEKREFLCKKCKH